MVHLVVILIWQFGRFSTDHQIKITTNTVVFIIGRPFLRAINFANGARKGVCGNYFHEPTLAELFTIHMNLHAMEFPLIFGETNFVEVPKSTKSTKFMALEKRAPYSISSLH